MLSEGDLCSYWWKPVSSTSIHSCALLVTTLDRFQTCLPVKALGNWAFAQCIGMVHQHSSRDCPKVFFFLQITYVLQSSRIYIGLLLLISNGFTMSQFYQQHCSFSILITALLLSFFLALSLWCEINCLLKLCIVLGWGPDQQTFTRHRPGSIG